MHYVIGTDEAGYGPNLGPLVISASVWRVPERVGAHELYERLQRVVSGEFRSSGAEVDRRVTIADSKSLYRPGGGLGNLERGLLSSLGVLDHCPATWQEIWEILAPASRVARESVPWYADYDISIPIEANRSQIQQLSDRLRQGCVDAEVQLVELRSRVVFPAEFNQLMERYQSKGAALSHTTLDLVAQLAAGLPWRSINAVCDKHGGRNRYAHLIAEHFPDLFIEIHGEGRAQSVYRFGPSDGRMEIRFCTKAEAYLPVALASMASKYLRELAMGAFNAFWCPRVPQLRPTAGYPKDAIRFKANIAEVQAELAIDDSALWRCK
jgi:hypothetical protein